MSKSHRSKRAQGLAAWNPKPETKTIITQVQQILREYQAHLPMTGRQIFYRLVGAYGYPKTENDYKNLLEYLNRARRARLIRWSAIRDDGVTSRGGGGFTTLDEWTQDVRTAHTWYGLNRMLGQPAIIELWVEAAGMVPQIQRVAIPYGASVYSSGGFNSVTMKHDAAQRFMHRWNQDGLPTVMLHIGDHDPSGVSIFENLSEDIGQFVEDYGYPAEIFVPERIAVTQEQADRYALDSAPPKATDTRSRSWTGETYQVEAMSPDQLAAEVTAAIDRHYDAEALEELLEREAEETERAEAFLATIDFSPLTDA